MQWQEWRIVSNVVKNVESLNSKNCRKYFYTQTCRIFKNIENLMKKSVWLQ
jgi:hypothetical protein